MAREGDDDGWIVRLAAGRLKAGGGGERKRPVKVALVSPPWYAVPPTAYGGVELVVHLLAEGLVARGVDVTLFASGDSETSAELAYVFEKAPSERIGESVVELEHVVQCVERAGEFDVVHDHSGPLGLTLLGLSGATVLHTVHGPLDERAGEVYERVCETVPRPWLVSLSLAQRRPRPELPWLANVPNAIEVDRYPLSTRRDGYLLFLGRMNATKGAHRAIEVARAAGLPLKIAAKCREPAEHEYFERCVKPRLGEGVEFFGEVDFDEKLALLQRASATLFPIDWEEPFGLVLIESAACGTPVVATRRGSIPEVVVEGLTGVIVDDHLQMPSVLERAIALPPEPMREDVERRFHADLMVSRYLDAYELAVDLDTRRRVPPSRLGRPGNVGAELRVGEPDPYVGRGTR